MSCNFCCENGNYVGEIRGNVAGFLEFEVGEYRDGYFTHPRPLL